MQQFNSEEEVLVWIQNWKIWPSSSHLPLLQRLREAMGERGSLEDCPGHCFSSNEFSDAISMTVLALEFYWDCLIVGKSGRCVFYVSHDEYYAFMTPDSSIAAGFKAEIEKGL